MARSLSNMLLKSLNNSLQATSVRTTVSGLFYCNGKNYSTKETSDSDTHDDFKPSSKLETSCLTLNDVVERDIKENPVMIYMEGVPHRPQFPHRPQCVFSAFAVRLFKEYNVPLSARNILENPDLKSAVKSFSHWPTFPQIFIKGEFLGGSDIILDMHRNGELKEKLKDIASKDTEEKPG